MSRKLAAAILGLLAAACTSIGPGTVPHDRIDYASAIGNSWKEQTLLNIVKLRYADMPIFLEVAQVIAGYQLQSTIGGSFTAGNFNAAVVGPFTASGNATAAGTYTDRPTVVYQPLTGVDFLRRLMTPIPPSSVLFVLQAGYSAERAMPIMLDSVNGLVNGSNRLKRASRSAIFSAGQTGARRSTRRHHPDPHRTAKGRSGERGNRVPAVQRPGIPRPTSGNDEASRAKTGFAGIEGVLWRVFRQRQ